VTDFVRDERGATAIEYALIATIISIVIVTSVTNMGTQIKAKLQSVVAGFH